MFGIFTLLDFCHFLKKFQFFSTIKRHLFFILYNFNIIFSGCSVSSVGRSSTLNVSSMISLIRTGNTNRNGWHSCFIVRFSSCIIGQFFSKSVKLQWIMDLIKLIDLSNFILCAIGSATSALLCFLSNNFRRRLVDRLVGLIDWYGCNIM